MGTIPIHRRADRATDVDGPEQGVFVALLCTRRIVVLGVIGSAAEEPAPVALQRRGVAVGRGLAERELPDIGGPSQGLLTIVEDVAAVFVHGLGFVVPRAAVPQCSCDEVASHKANW